MSVLRKHVGTKPHWYKKVATDARLSLEASGLLFFLLSQPEGWKATTATITRERQQGSAQALCRELMGLGYMTRQLPKGKQPIMHVSDLASEQWAKRNAAQEWDSKPPASQPVSANELAKACGTAADILALADPDDPESSQVEMDGPTAIARRVLVEWATAVGRNLDRARMTAERLSAVKGRLKEGFSEEELIYAVRGIALSSWHMGENPESKKWNDMSLALRNGTNVEKFRDLYLAGGEEKLDAVDHAVAMLREMGFE